jgi:peptidoglycan-associated lipoprotein
MIRIVLASLLVGGVVVGCAHDEEKAKPTTVAKEAPAPAAKPRAPVAPTEAPVAEAPPSKDDDAIYFDFDSSLVRDDARPVLQKVGAEVKRRKESLKVEGNCDEVGTVEYNLALGEARARSAKEYLVHLGVPASHIAIASYGSQRPKYPGHDDEAHAKNRRDDFIVR